MIEVTLGADRLQYVVGETLEPRLRVRNISVAPLLFVGILDGSELGFRYPHYLPRVTGPPGPWGQIEAPDFTAPLRPTDFRTLGPGEELDPTDASGGGTYVPIATFQYLTGAPGRYTMSICVSTESDAIEQWFGTLPAPPEPAVPALLARVPRLTVCSNLLTIDVRAR